MNAMEMSEFLIGLDVGKGAVGIVFPTVENAVVPAGCLAIVTPRQTHTANVAVVTDTAQSYPDTDALVTRRHDIALAVRTADCVPILLHAPDIRAVAAVHAGWKGTVGRIIGNAIRVMTEMGAEPQKNTCCHRTMCMRRLLRSERRTCHTLSGRRSGRSRHQKRPIQKSRPSAHRPSTCQQNHNDKTWHTPLPYIRLRHLHLPHHPIPLLATRFRHSPTPPHSHTPLQSTATIKFNH